MASVLPSILAGASARGADPKPLLAPGRGTRLMEAVRLLPNCHFGFMWGSVRVFKFQSRCVAASMPSDVRVLKVYVFK